MNTTSPRTVLIFTIVVSLFFFGTAILFLPAEAQPGTASLPPNQQGPVQQFFGASTLSDLFNAGFKVAIVIGAMLAVVRLVWAGAIYMSTDAFGVKGDAKGMIKNAMTGLLLLLAIWLILFQINPDLLNLNILQGVTSAPASQQSSGSSLSQPGNTQWSTTPPAQNSFVGGAGGEFDSSLQGCGTSGCGDQSQQFAPGLF